MESSGLTRKACQIREKGLGLRRLRELITFFILVIIIHPIVIGDCQIGNDKRIFQEKFKLSIPMWIWGRIHINQCTMLELPTIRMNNSITLDIILI